MAPAANQRLPGIAYGVAATASGVRRSMIDAAEAERLRAREVVLYCACPNETTSARVALLLKRQGITRVRPLEGGIAAWMALGFPVQAVEPPVVAVDERGDRTPSQAA